MESQNDKRPVSRELAGGEIQGAKEHFYGLPDKHIPNCPPSQLDNYHRARAVHGILIGLTGRRVTYRTSAAGLMASEFVATWDKFEAATDAALRYGFFQIALRKLIGLHTHTKDIRLGRRRVL